MSDVRSSDWTGRGPSDVSAKAGQGPGANGGRHPGGQAPPLAAAKRPRKSSSRAHRSSSHSRRKIRQLKLLAVLLTAALVASLVVSVVMYFRVQQVRGGQSTMTVEQKQLEAELAKAQERITALNSDLRILLANRIPGVDEIAYNRQIELNDQYVKTITFVESGLGDDKTVEFSAVLQNVRTGPILPNVTIALFDETGLQTGMVRLDKTQTISPVDIPEMQPGETRTYSARIELDRKEPSKYFVVEVR